MMRSERGSASVLVVGVVGVVLSATASVLVLAGVLAASQQARLAADLGALAGASRLQEAASAQAACTEARRVIRANHAELRTCSAEGLELEVTASVRATTWPSDAVARARAGPSHERSAP